MKCATTECSIKRILVCVDGSENSMRAVAASVDLALSFKAQITLLTVDGSSGPGFQPVPEDGSEESNRYYSVLDEASKLLIERRVMFEPMVVRGDPAEVITIVAAGEEGKDNSFDMIIMGKRGMNLMDQIVFGSVSQKVSHHSKVPVLVVP